jgi:hypothetical protein
MLGNWSVALKKKSLVQALNHSDARHTLLEGDGLSDPRDFGWGSSRKEPDGPEADGLAQ